MGTLGAVTLGVLVGVGIGTWSSTPPALPVQHAVADAPADPHLANIEQSMTAMTQALHATQSELEQAVTVLTQTLHATQANPAPSEPTRETASPTESPRRLAHLIRKEIRQAMANESPDNRRAREEAEVVAQVLASPENRAAYASATQVVAGAVATRRWTEEDKVAFRAAFSHLTNEQRAELMRTLAPAINRGELQVEIRGPLF